MTKEEANAAIAAAKEAMAANNGLVTVYLNPIKQTQSKTLHPLECSRTKHGHTRFMLRGHCVGVNYLRVLLMKDYATEAAA